MDTKRRVIAILMGWILFIGVDFLFHASILESFWKEEIASFKSAENLAFLIPVGYGSFLLLTILIGYLFFRLFPEKPTVRETANFGLIFGLLFSLSNFLGLWSYVEIPVKHLALFNGVYFIEILMVTFSIYTIAFSTKLSKSVWRSLLVFLFLIVMGILIQNIR